MERWFCVVRSMLGSNTTKLNKNYKNGSKLKAFSAELVKNKVLFLMLLPGTIFLLINNYAPMLGLVIAFQEVDYRKGVFRGDWVGLDNFKFFLDTAYAFIITRNTLLYNLVFIFLGLVVAVFLAIALNELKNKTLAKFYQSTMFLPYFMSWIVVSYIAFAFLGNEYGFINSTILKFFNVDPIAWYVEPKYWPVIIVFLNIWKGVGYSSIVYLAAIANFDIEYYEAASIDGANRWQQITKITLPLLQPIIIIMVLLAVGKIFNSDFGLFYTVPRDSGILYPVTNTIDTYIYRAMSNGVGDISMAAAAGAYQSIVGFVCVMASNMVVKKVDPERALF